VLAAGGIGSARAMAAALTAGADGVRVGTRFVATAESGSHPAYIQALVEASAADTVITTAFSMAPPRQSRGPLHRTRPRLARPQDRHRRSAVSQHLKILKDAGLVEDVAAGTRRIYRLNPVALAALRDQLDTYWQRALAGYADAVEAPTEED
jgi:NAD(P)H-dependent flavin oxidoreductase YrpB (nitropropane dioxygenase family)